MPMELNNAMNVSASGMKAQALRLRVISENLANADSVSTVVGGSPYRRKTIQFGNVLNRERDVDMVEVKRIRVDRSDFKKEYSPNHPAADKDGYILMPNVNRFVEMTDMKEAQRSYEANLQSLDTSRRMMRETLGILSK